MFSWKHSGIAEANKLPMDEKRSADPIWAFFTSGLRIRANPIRKAGNIDATEYRIKKFATYTPGNNDLCKSFDDVYA